MIICETCGQPGGILALSGPCFDCARARMKAAYSGRCSCPKRLRRPRTIETRIRSWVTDDRCLGTIAQLN